MMIVVYWIKSLENIIPQRTYLVRKVVDAKGRLIYRDRLVRQR